jgi:hypothetical protein
VHFLVVVDFVIIESVKGVPLRRVSRHVGMHVTPSSVSIGHGLSEIRNIPVAEQSSRNSDFHANREKRKRSSDRDIYAKPVKAVDLPTELGGDILTHLKEYPN